MAQPQLTLVTPTLDVERTIAGGRTAPTRLPNAAYRSREYLTPTEMDAIIEAARKMRHGHRDATMLLVCYRHGFRASEICDLRWSQIDFDQARLAVRRSKRGTASTHPILGDELRALRRLRRENPHAEFVFMSERGGPFRPQDSHGSWRGPAPKRGSASKLTLTCFGTARVTNWPTMASTPEHCSITSAIATSIIR
jgi:integrase